MADAPFGARSNAASTVQEPCGPGWSFSGSSWTLARRSSCRHGRAVGTACGVLRNKRRVVTYRVARLEDVAEVAPNGVQLLLDDTPCHLGQDRCRGLQNESGAGPGTVIP